MRHLTPARLRAAGTLLLEIASVAANIAAHIKSDPKLNSALHKLVTRVRAL